MDFLEAIRTNLLSLAVLGCALGVIAALCGCCAVTSSEVDTFPHLS
jgi:hypothetical protein